VEPQRVLTSASRIRYGFKVDANEPKFVKATMPLFSDTLPRQVLAHRQADSRIVAASSHEETAQSFSLSASVEGNYKAFEGAVRTSTNSMNSKQVKKMRIDKEVLAMVSKVGMTEPGPHAYLTDTARNFLLVEAPEKITQTYGEFYATELVLGGVFQSTFVKEHNEFTSMMDFKAEVEASYSWLIASASVSAATHIRNEREGQSTAIDVQVKAQGGDVNKCLGLSEDNLQSVQREWSETVDDSNSYPVAHSLHPIWELIEPLDEDKAQAVKTHLESTWITVHDALDVEMNSIEFLRYGDAVVLENLAYTPQYLGSDDPTWLQHGVNANNAATKQGTMITGSYDRKSVRERKCMWRIEFRNEDKTGQDVKYGDEFILRNEFNKDEFLGQAGLTDSWASVRDGVAVWRIMPYTRGAWDTSFDNGEQAPLGRDIIIENAKDYSWLGRHYWNSAAYANNNDKTNMKRDGVTVWKIKLPPRF